MDACPTLARRLHRRRPRPGAVRRRARPRSFARARRRAAFRGRGHLRQARRLRRHLARRRQHLDRLLRPWHQHPARSVPARQCTHRRRPGDSRHQRRADRRRLRRFRRTASRRRQRRLPARRVRSADRERRPTRAHAKRSGRREAVRRRPPHTFLPVEEAEDEPDHTLAATHSRSACRPSDLRPRPRRRRRPPARLRRLSTGETPRRAGNDRSRLQPFRCSRRPPPRRSASTTWRTVSSEAQGRHYWQRNGSSALRPSSADSTASPSNHCSRR